MAKMRRFIPLTSVVILALFVSACEQSQGAAPAGAGVTATPAGARASQFAVATPTATATSTPTSTLIPTSSPTLSPTAATASGSSVYFPIGTGSSDVIPRQLVRTNDDRVYVFANQQYSTRLWAYWTTAAGLPSAQTDFAGSASLSDGANLISVDAVYDGSSTIHVLVNTQAGLLKDYAFDLATNTFKPALTLASDSYAVSGDYLGSSGVSGMVDQSGALHVAYWSNGNHILHTAYTYDSASNLLTPMAAAMQVDTASVAANHPAVAVSPVDNSLTVVWVSESEPAQILARTRTRAGVWGSVETVSTGPVWTSPYFGVNIDQGPSLVITSDGTQLLAYIENWDDTGNYGHVHYAANTGTGWVDQALGMWTHDPALAVNSAGGVYILGHGHPKNADTYGAGSPCLDMRDMCFLKKNGDGTWAAPQLLAGHTGESDSFDSSPSVKWGVVGWNRPETVEFLFFSVVNGDYGNPTLYYARLP